VGVRHLTTNVPTTAGTTPHLHSRYYSTNTTYVARQQQDIYPSRRSNAPKTVFVSLYSLVASVRINEPKLNSSILSSYLNRWMSGSCMNKLRRQLRTGSGGEDALFDKGAPALLPLVALHPVLVQQAEARMRRRRKLGKVAQRVLKNIVIIPVRTHQCESTERMRMSGQTL